ncbi:FadR/GntR family transcriptional regulator [Azospirillum thermophilum]|uniref:FadR family transcriptional regulator n=1 Tax=Azospirillum thermophilum TaxID=2202148 RepID=A0A2S2CV92_9PROT|nr:FCD domain-containing protein [Azospirillum thermophilum]AWK88432.1 FadR family transcriptional regulator [Azospirillum thermophilum]
MSIVPPPPAPSPSGACSLAAVPRRSLVETAIGMMRAELERGGWPVGSRIPPEAELAAALQVSRNTVREAIRVLSHAGMLEVRQGNGTYVRSPVDPAETMRRIARTTLRDHLELRCTLEVQAAGLAALRRTDSDLERIRGALEARGDTAAKEPGDAALEAFIDRDIAFHMAVAEAAHNVALAELYRYFTGTMRGQLRAALRDSALPEPDLPAHHAVADAIAARDRAAAEEAARAIVAPSLAALDALLAP